MHANEQVSKHTADILLSGAAGDPIPLPNTDAKENSK